MAKTVLITGAASGIGEALAGEHIARGDHVIAVDRDGDALGPLASPGADTHALDVSDVDGVEALTGRVWAACGGVDIVYANAGVSSGGRVLKATPQQFAACFNVNLIGAWATLRAVAVRMIDAGRPGALCVTGSEHSLGFQHAGAGVYTASKHAVLGLADVLRHELPETITLSVLCPGLTATGMGETPGASEAANAMGRAVMAEGLDPRVVARAAMAGTERGDFIITTHAASRLGWDTRVADIEAGFASVPPEGADIERYAVPAAVARARVKLGEG